MHRGLRLVALVRKPDAAMSNATLRATTQMSDVEVVLACSRLSLLRRVIIAGISWILALIQASSLIDHGWSRLVEADWGWLLKFGDD